MRRLVFCIIFAVGLFGTDVDCAVSIRRVYVSDMTGAVRTTYSSTERIKLGVDIYNSATADRIEFIFRIYDTAGAKILEHKGNSIPGSVGSGGSSLDNVAISRFYKTPGSYTLEVEAHAISVTTLYDSASSKTSFFVYSPVLTLLYPSNMSMDLSDNPLVFRWSGSGATKYKLYVDDDVSFYNCLFSAETFDTSYTYPTNPSDVRQRLKGGQNYYWKVEGLDVYGNVVSASAQPFSFTIKDTAASQGSRDVGIVALDAHKMSGNTEILVDIRNYGSRGESNITVYLYVNGVHVGSQNVSFINAGQTLRLIFNVSQYQDDKITVTAAHNFSDDIPANNILTRIVSLLSVANDEVGEQHKHLARVEGKIMIEASSSSPSSEVKRGISGALISYSGPVSGEVYSDKNGLYKIEGLKKGTYKISVAADGYYPADTSIEIQHVPRTYPRVDIYLTPRSSSEVSSQMSSASLLNNWWENFKKYLSPATMALLGDEYQITTIEGVSPDEYDRLLESIKTGKARIIKEKIE